MYDIALVVGNFLFRRNRYQKAIDFYKEAQILLNNEKNLPTHKMKSYVTLLYFRLANAFYSTGNLDEALTNCNHCIKISEEIGHRQAQVKAYKTIICVYSRLNRYAEVIFYERKLLQHAKENGDRQEQARVYESMGLRYFELGKLNKAFECHNEALKISREIGDRLRESQVHSWLGTMYKQHGEYDKAISHLQNALEIQKETGNYRDEAGTYQNLGNTYHECGKYDKALECHDMSLKMMTTLGNLGGLGVCYNNIATTYAMVGRINEALELFLKTLKIMSEVGNGGYEGRAHFGLGNCYSELGQFNKSLEHYEMALKHLEETGDRFGVGRSCTKLGATYNRIGHYNQAITFCERARKIGKQIADRKLESNAYQGLGEAYFAIDPQSGKGENYVKKALEISKETGDKYQSSLDHATLASMYCRKGQYALSLENNQSAIIISKEIGDRSGEASALSCLASVYLALGKAKEAKEHLQKAQRIMREIGEKWREHRVLYSLGICSFYDKEFEKGRQYLYESVICVERDRKLLRDEHKLSLDNLTFYNYTALCRLLIIQGNVLEALCTAERGRSRALVDLMSKNYGIGTRSRYDDIHLTEIQSLSIQSQCTIIFVAIADANILYFWVVQQKGNVRFKMSISKSREERITNLFKLSREQLLRTWLDNRKGESEDRSLAAYYKESKAERRLVEEEDNQTKLKTGAKESALQLLYKRIFAPVADHIQNQDIILIPEGDMWMVPFPALKDADGKFLSETFRIRTIPSFTVLRLIQTSPHDYHTQTGALILGDPEAHPKTGLLPLPEARKEAEEIAELLGVKAIVGRQATKTEVLRRIRDVTLIHIAAHGDAERGEIALSSNPSCRLPKREEFMLTMEDVVKVGVRAKLVVLSCCHSGRGRILKSEGVVGIARAFLAAGARSVLVSLWVLDDKSTKEFMIRFYRHLVRDQLTASQALHLSMKWMRESAEYNCVGDWAPFVLIGDDVKLNISPEETQ